MVTTNIWQIEQQPKLIEELGRVTVRWAALDLLLVQIAAIALKNRPAAWSIIFSGSNAGQARFSEFNRVIGASYFDQEERSAILHHTKTLSKLYRTRNSLIHEPLEGTYHIDGKRISFHLQFISRNGQPKKASIEVIDAHIRTVDECLEALESISDDLLEKYEPLESEW